MIQLIFFKKKNNDLNFFVLGFESSCSNGVISNKAHQSYCHSKHQPISLNVPELNNINVTRSQQMNSYSRWVNSIQPDAKPDLHRYLPFFFCIRKIVVDGFNISPFHCSQKGLNIPPPAVYINIIVICPEPERV